MQILKALLFAALVALASAKVYERCELAQELLYNHHLPSNQIATWVCIIYHESTYNTAAKNPNGQYFGLFQVGSPYWCSPPGTGCGVNCAEMVDDVIADDVKCALTIFDVTQGEQGNGFLAWSTYSKCQSNLEQWTDGCFQYS